MDAREFLEGCQGKNAEELIEALSDAGFVILPKEPTPEMLALAHAVARLQLTDDIEDRSEERHHEEFATAYRSMIAAASPPPRKGE